MKEEVDPFRKLPRFVTDLLRKNPEHEGKEDDVLELMAKSLLSEVQRGEYGVEVDDNPTLASITFTSDMGKVSFTFEPSGGKRHEAALCHKIVRNFLLELPNGYFEQRSSDMETVLNTRLTTKRGMGVLIKTYPGEMGSTPPFKVVAVLEPERISAHSLAAMTLALACALTELKWQLGDSLTFWPPELAEE